MKSIEEIVREHIQEELNTPYLVGDIDALVKALQRWRLEDTRLATVEFFGEWKDKAEASFVRERSLADEVRRLLKQRDQAMETIWEVETKWNTAQTLGLAYKDRADLYEKYLRRCAEAIDAWDNCDINDDTRNEQLREVMRSLRTEVFAMFGGHKR